MRRVANLVGFDATPLEVAHRAGVSHYVAHLLEALVERRDGWQYGLLASRRLQGPIAPGTLRHLGPRLPNRWLWLQLVLPVYLARLRPRLCHYTNAMAPIVAPRPFVLTVYDMSLFLHARTQPARSLLAIRTLMPIAIRRAAAVMAPSESARRDIAAIAGVPADRIHVTRAGVAPWFRPVSDAAELDRVRRKYALDGPFVLAVGTIEPRKNLGRLLSALEQARRRGRPETLIVAGQFGWRYGELVRQLDAMRAAGCARTLGYVPDEDMPALYSLARALAFPSLYEGFGLPILEAMACGLPVLTSDQSAMRELAGAAAVLVDPERVDAIAEGLVEILADAARRDTLRAAGFERSREFTWARSAQATVQVYERATTAVP